MDEPFCFDGDVDKSFQLVFPARTVDLVAKDAEEASLLARGFQVHVCVYACTVCMFDDNINTHQDDGGDDYQMLSDDRR